CCCCTWSEVSLLRLVRRCQHLFFPTRRSSDLFQRGFAAHGARPTLLDAFAGLGQQARGALLALAHPLAQFARGAVVALLDLVGRSEEHTSELQSRENLVCRLLLEKKKCVYGNI